VDTLKAKEYSNSIGGVFQETSAKEDDGIEHLFFEIAKRLIAQRLHQQQRSLELDNNTGNGNAPIDISKNQGDKKAKEKCPC
jgi:hypothetical protein